MASLGAQTAPTVIYPLDLHSGDAFPGGDRGFVFLRQGSGEDRPFVVYRPDGSLAYRVRLPGVVIDAAFEADGSAAVALTGPTATLLLLNPDGRTALKLTPTAFQPNRVAFAPDHTLWILGSARPDGGGILRHFSRDGALLSSYLDRPSISDSIDRAGRAHLGLSREHVGIYDPSRREWTELDFEGHITGHWILPYPEVDQGALPEPPPAPRFQGFGFTRNGQLFARIFGAGITVQRFDKKTLKWQPVGEPGSFLIGVNGESLMLATTTVPLRVITLLP